MRNKILFANKHQLCYNAQPLGWYAESTWLRLATVVVMVLLLLLGLKPKTQPTDADSNILELFVLFLPWFPFYIFIQHYYVDETIFWIFPFVSCVCVRRNAWDDTSWGLVCLPNKIWSWVAAAACTEACTILRHQLACWSRTTMKYIELCHKGSLGVVVVGAGAAPTTTSTKPAKCVSVYHVENSPRSRLNELWRMMMKLGWDGWLMASPEQKQMYPCACNDVNVIRTTTQLTAAGRYQPLEKCQLAPETQITIIKCHTNCFSAPVVHCTLSSHGTLCRKLLHDDDSTGHLQFI